MYVNPMTAIYVFGKDKKSQTQGEINRYYEYLYISRGKIT